MENSSEAPQIEVVEKADKSFGAKIDKIDNLEDPENMGIPPGSVDPEKQRFPYCVVWTPIPFLT